MWPIVYQSELTGCSRLLTQITIQFIESERERVKQLTAPGNPAPVAALLDLIALMARLPRETIDELDCADIMRLQIETTLLILEASDDWTVAPESEQIQAMLRHSSAVSGDLHARLLAAITKRILKEMARDDTQHPA